MSVRVVGAALGAAALAAGALLAARGRRPHEKGGAASSTEAAKAAASASAPAPAPALSEEELRQRSVEALASAPTVDASGAPITRNEMVRTIVDLQNKICAAAEAMEGSGGARFREERSARKSGGGSVARVLQGGRVFEKAGVMLSVVFVHDTPESMIASMTQRNQLVRDLLAASRAAGQPLSMFVCGISLILHPLNPYAPTVHMNLRYFELGSGARTVSWVGGGADLTPHYVFDEDCVHFHRKLREACDRYDAAYYPRFKEACDRYFYLAHRKEHRGIGGIFFDDLDDKLPATLMRLVRDVGLAFIEAYFPVVQRRKDTSFGERERQWQELRHGRYVEFNLLYDRGTKFGLATPDANIENILVSLPLTVRYEYMHVPPAGSDEARALEVLRKPRDWLAAK